jgi:hypothetical protein
VNLPPVGRPSTACTFCRHLRSPISDNSGHLPYYDENGSSYGDWEIELAIKRLSVRRSLSAC